MNNEVRTLALAAALVVGLAAVPAGGEAQRVRARMGYDDMKPYRTATVAKTLRFADPAKTGELIVDNLCGPIAVEAYAGREVVLEAKKTVFARDEARAAKAEEEVRLDLSEKGNTVEAYVDGPFRDEEGPNGIHTHRDPGYMVRYDFTVKVPARTDLVLKTVIDGDIEVRGVEGRFDVHNVTGRVRLVDAAGSGKAQTVANSVTVAFRRPPDGPCSLKSVSGDVEIDLPGEPSADFRFKTMNGEVYSDFDVTRLPNAAPVREERRPGDNAAYRYRSGGFTGVRAGKGGPEISLETLTGDILIAKRSKTTS
jgi:hypothetical protein